MRIWLICYLTVRNFFTVIFDFLSGFNFQTEILRQLKQPFARRYLILLT